MPLAVAAAAAWGIVVFVILTPVPAWAGGGQLEERPDADLERGVEVEWLSPRQLLLLRRVWVDL